MTFWLIASGLALAVTAALVLAMLRGRNETPADPAASDMQVYRDQLREVDRDLARGVVSEADAERVRTEISRRLLDADRAARTGEATIRPAPRRMNQALVALTAAGVLGGTGALYWQLGAPGYRDLPLTDRIAAAEEIRATRPAQSAAEAEAGLRLPPASEASPEFLDLMQRLRGAVAERPGDLRGQQLLARNEAVLGRYAQAWRAQQRVIEIKGDAATADDFAELADLMVLAAGGYVSPETETVLNQTLARDPDNGTARYYIGLMAAQTGRPDMAFRFWQALLEDSPPDAAWVPPIRAQIEDLAELSGVRYTLPPLDTAPGPDAGDIAAAAAMSPEERAAMIRSMVDGLSDRLATEGGPPEDWARLIGALGVLGETERARAIADEAAAVFADDAAAQQLIAQARRRAGLGP